MSSPDATPPPEAPGQGAARAPAEPPGRLPPALPSMWRLCRLGFHYEPALMGVSFVLALAAALPDALLAVWFTLLGEGLIQHKPGLLWFAAVALAVSAVATWLLATVSTRIQRRFRDKVTIALESHVAGLQANISTIAHQERPEYLDRLSVLREQIFTLDHMYMSVFSTAGWILRLGITVVLLASVNPVLIALVLFAIPTVAATSWRPAVERAAQERGAQADRLARHLFADWLRLQDVEEEEIETLVLVASELCANAVRAASGAPGGVVLRAESVGCDVCIEVEDDGGRFDRSVDYEEMPSAYAESGRGLFLAHALSHQLEFEVEADVRTVVRSRRHNVLPQGPA